MSCAQHSIIRLVRCSNADTRVDQFACMVSALTQTASVLKTTAMVVASLASKPSLYKQTVWCNQTHHPKPTATFFGAVLAAPPQASTSAHMSLTHPKQKPHHKCSQCNPMLQLSRPLPSRLLLLARVRRPLLLLTCSSTTTHPLIHLQAITIKAIPFQQ